MTYLTFLGNYVGPQNAFKWVERGLGTKSVLKNGNCMGLQLGMKVTTGKYSGFFVLFILNFFIRKNKGKSDVDGSRELGHKCKALEQLRTTFRKFFVAVDDDCYIC